MLRENIMILKPENIRYKSLFAYIFAQIRKHYEGIVDLFLPGILEYSREKSGNRLVINVNYLRNNWKETSVRQELKIIPAKI